MQSDKLITSDELRVTWKRPTSVTYYPDMCLKGLRNFTNYGDVCGVEVLNMPCSESQTFDSEFGALWQWMHPFSPRPFYPGIESRYVWRYDKSYMYIIFMLLPLHFKLLRPLRQSWSRRPSESEIILLSIYFSICSSSGFVLHKQLKETFEMLYPFKYEAQTALFKDPVRTAL